MTAPLLPFDPFNVVRDMLDQAEQRADKAKLPQPVTPVREQRCWHCHEGYYTTHYGDSERSEACEYCNATGKLWL